MRMGGFRGGGGAWGLDPDCAYAHWQIQRGDMGSGPPLKNHKTIGFSSNTGMDLLKKSQGYQASIKCWAIIGTTVSPIIN